jgi:hypothetical protein
LAAGKIGLGILAAPETGGISLYGAYSGVGNLVSAGAEFYGAYSGNYGAARRVSTYASAFSSLSGIITTAVTGNASKGAVASTVEGIGLIGVTGGLVSTGGMAAPSVTDNAVNALDTAYGITGIGIESICHE